MAAENARAAEARNQARLSARAAKVRAGRQTMREDVTAKAALQREEAARVLAVRAAFEDERRARGAHLDTRSAIQVLREHKHPNVEGTSLIFPREVPKTKPPKLTRRRIGQLV